MKKPSSNPQFFIFLKQKKSHSKTVSIQTDVEAEFLKRFNNRREKCQITNVKDLFYSSVNIFHFLFRKQIDL